LARPAVIESSGCGSFKWAQEATDQAVAEIERLIKAELDELKWGQSVSMTIVGLDVPEHWSG
jgi:hypothetical protein